MDTLYVAELSKTDPRFKMTIDFIDDLEKPVLDIGSKNSFGKILGEYYNVKIYNTTGDLDLDNWFPNELDLFKTVFCFEVIEHLMSPKMFLTRLKKYIVKDSVIYLTYPRRHEPFWTDVHFHEYHPQRFRYLLKTCDYQILKYKWFYYTPENFKLKLGIRPLFRLTPLAKIKLQMYKLRLEKS